uniref:Uncharacterized protein n=1 Tax=Anguilla anguilla TaxID=7936 RepID=A0A0E9SDT9_ANGAN
MCPFPVFLVQCCWYLAHWSFLHVNSPWQGLFCRYTSF